MPDHLDPETAGRWLSEVDRLGDRLSDPSRREALEHLHRQGRRGGRRGGRRRG